jgi:hypothetical protein
MQLIGLTGFAGSGKDFTHKAIEKFFQEDDRTWVYRVALADELRQEIEDLFTVDGRYLPAVWEKPYSDGVRWILQHYGTEFRRAQDEDYWSNKAAITIGAFDQPGQIVVVTDVRFANEADMIHGLGGIVVEVQAPAGVRAGRLGGALPPAHASEVIDFETDAVIRNTGVPVLPETVLDFIGLDHRCNGCITLDASLCR